MTDKVRLTDGFHRCLNYLRLSVTDRCNLRCMYCMPQTAFSWMPADEILSYEEILKVCRVLADLGVEKVRLTGGEPLVRKDLERLIGGMADLPGIKELCLTTNGVLLERSARSLYDAGIRHINISLDSLVPGKYKYITGFDLFEQVWAGLHAALETGFSPVKINCVIMKGVNDDEIVDMASLCLRFPLEIRFIEFMPIGEDSFWDPGRLMTNDQVKKVIEQDLGTLHEVGNPGGGGPAVIYTLDGAIGKLGFISPMSHHFCATCNRLRLTADGRLRLCLFSDREVDIRSIIRKGISLEELESFFRKVVLLKPRGYEHLGKLQPSCSRQMSSIGG